MKLTDFDTGRRFTAEFFPPETQARILKDRPTRPAPKCKLSDQEFARRQAMVRAAAARVGGPKLLADHLGVSRSDVSKWTGGRRPTPTRYLDKLAKLTRRAAA